MSTRKFQSIIEDGINDFCSNLPINPKDLYNPISYTLASGGKRMRPLLTLLACEMFDGNIKECVPAAIAIEVFHNFSLLHDDIMDNAPLRRKNPTVHIKWNSNVAILSGDTMLVKAYELLTSCNPNSLKNILKVFNDVALGVCEGQQFDMEFETRHDVDIKEYIRMIELKTAVLLAGALKIGALSANASDVDADNLFEFGRNIGISFQLQDDILDVYGDPDKFGKQIGGDIICNKKTFLLLKALELAEGKSRNKLMELLSLNDFNETEKINAITEIYNSLNIRRLAEKEMNKYYNKGIHHLNQVDIDNSKKLPLLKLAENLMIRES